MLVRRLNANIRWRMLWFSNELERLFFYFIWLTIGRVEQGNALQKHNSVRGTHFLLIPGWVAILAF